jgi:hypothetical protein
LEIAFTPASQKIVKNAKNILDSAERFGVDPQTLASILFTEQHYNVNLRDHLTDVPLALVGVNISSIGIAQIQYRRARELEQRGYMPITMATYVPIKIGNITVPRVVATARQNLIIKLMNDKINIDYAAAYLAYHQDTWREAYPNIANNPGVLGTLYNIREKTPHSNPQVSKEFGIPVQNHYNAMGFLLGQK